MSIFLRIKIFEQQIRKFYLMISKKMFYFLDIFVTRVKVSIEN